MQQRLKARTVSDLDYDEVLFHVLKSSHVMYDSTVDEEPFQALKEYLQGIYPLTVRPLFKKLLFRWCKFQL